MRQRGSFDSLVGSFRSPQLVWVRQSAESGGLTQIHRYYSDITVYIYIYTCIHTHTGDAKDVGVSHNHCHA